MSFVLKDITLNPLEIIGDPNGILLIFKEPDPNRVYYMGVDVGTGTGLSNSVVHVLERGEIEGQVDEQVAEFACDFLDPHQLAPIVDKIGRIYYSEQNDLPAEAVIESYPGPGEGTQYDLLTFYEYPNIFMRQVYDSQNDIYTTKYGWSSDRRSRRRIVLWGEHQLRTGQWKINSPWMLDEMRDFKMIKAVSPSGKDSEEEAIAEARASARARRGARDDRILAGFIAEWAANAVREGREDPAVSRARAEQASRKREATNADFQNTAQTYEEMMESF